MNSNQRRGYPRRERSSPESDSNSDGRSPPEQTKRRPSRAGTRSVSQLSQAQLERKRANDREAQRAIRQRTKDKMRTLEKRIEELQGSGESNQPLAEALARIKELEEENSQLRVRLDQAGIPASASERSGSWDEMTERAGPSPLQMPSGMQIAGPPARSPSLLSPRESHSSPHHGHGFRSMGHWQTANPFGEGSGAGKVEGSASPASQISHQQYPSWAATGTERARMHPHESPALQPSVEYPGVANEQSPHAQTIPYQSFAASSAHSQGGIVLPQSMVQYAPIAGGPYMHQHAPQQHPGQQPPSGHGPSRTPSSQSNQDSQSMYYGNYPPPS